MLSADNLRFFLEVARAARLSEAARVLEVDHTTVGRRITTLEKTLGQRLFDRSPGGWRLTESGKALLPRAEAVEAAVTAAFDSQATSPSGPLTGSIRIATTDGFGAFLIAPKLIELRAAHPHLNVELVTATAHNTISDRHFDLAVTLERPTSRAVYAVPLAHYYLRLYASPAYLSRHTPITQLSDLLGHTVIWYVNALLDVEPLRILDSLPHQQKVSVQISNIAGHWLSARSGLGVAPLPGYIGNSDRELVPVLADTFNIRRLYWLVVPRELDRLRRVRATRDFLTTMVAEHPDLETPSSP